MGPGAQNIQKLIVFYFKKTLNELLGYSTTYKTFIFSVTKVNDIALLKLEVPHASGRSENHPAIAMNIPTNNMEITGKYCTVSGWGRLESGGFQRPHILMTVDVLVRSNDVCAEMLGTNLPWDR